MAMTTYLGNKLLDHAIGRTAFAMPTVHLGLFSAAPGVGGGGTEASYTGYARVALGTGGASLFGAAAALASENSSAITFGTKTAGADVTVTHWATFDAASAGNMLEFGALGASKLIQNNDTPTFAIGDFDRTAA